MNDEDRWRRLKELVAAAEDLDPHEQAEYLDAHCDDEELREEVRALLNILPEPEAGSLGFLGQAAVGEIQGEIFQPGDEIGAFRIQSRIGAGGMGDVYLAERSDGAYEEKVAIKVVRLKGGPAELRERFLSERRLMAQLRHPWIAQLLDAGALEDGRPYFVMEWIDGQPVDAYCEKNQLSVEKIVELMSQVTEAVAHAHRNLVVHRDLKPANIFVDHSGAPKLLDFGIAKDLSDLHKTPATRLLSPMTPEYASPEQLAGRPVQTGADVYALGVILYELLAGCGPFGGEDDPLAGRSRDSPPTLPSERVGQQTRASRILRKELRGDLDALVMRALDPDPETRYSSAEALGRDLRNFLGGYPLDIGEGWLYRSGKWIRRYGKELVAAFLLIASLVGWTFNHQKAERSLEQRRLISSHTDELGDFMVEILTAANPEHSGTDNAVFVEMIEKGTSSLVEENRFEQNPLVRAALLSALGQVHRRLGNAEQAEPLLRECLEVRRRLLSPQDLFIGVAANNLGVTLRQLGRFEESRSLLREVEGILRIRLQQNPRDAEAASRLPILLNNLGGVEKELGHFDASVEAFKEALEWKEKLWPHENLKLAAARKNLASGLLAAGRLEEADRQLSLAARQTSQDDQPSRRLTILQSGIDHYLGILDWKRGDLEGASEHLASALESRQSLLGQSDYRTIASASAWEAVRAAEPEFSGSEVFQEDLGEGVSPPVTP